MERAALAPKIINRVFDADVTYQHVSNTCMEAVVYGLYGVEIFPNMIEFCKQLLEGTGVKLCAVITYPHGTYLPEQKAFEIQDAIQAGADEVEVCLNCLNARSLDWAAVDAEMRECRAAAGAHTLRFILEIEYLTEEMIRECCKLAVKNRVDAVVTSTGLYSTLDEHKQDVPIPVTPEQVELLKSCLGGAVKIVAQGNVDSAEMAASLLAAGADFIGTRHTRQIMNQLKKG